jgi:hypothetical protein
MRIKCVQLDGAHTYIMLSPCPLFSQRKALQAKKRLLLARSAGVAWADARQFISAPRLISSPCLETPSARDERERERLFVCASLNIQLMCVCDRQGVQQRPCFYKFSRETAIVLSYIQRALEEDARSSCCCAAETPFCSKCAAESLRRRLLIKSPRLLTKSAG